MTLSIRQQLVGDTAYSFGRNNKKRYLTIHETGNPSPGANAAAHANLQSRPNPSEVAWHWQVDDREAVQSFTHDFQLWHAGDGSGDGNLNSISIETCIHEGIDWAACKQNLVELAAQIVTSEGIPLSNVVQHNHWSGKDCPTRLRADGGAEWRELYNAIAARVNGQADPPSFGGDAASYVGKQIDIDEWWNYKTANDAEQLVNKVRVMPAGRYTVTKVNGQTPHLVKDDNKASRSPGCWQRLPRGTSLDVHGGSWRYPARYRSAARHHVADAPTAQRDTGCERHLPRPRVATAVTMRDVALLIIVAAIALVCVAATWWAWQQLVTFVELYAWMLDLINRSGEPWN